MIKHSFLHFDNHDKQTVVLPKDFHKIRFFQYIEFVSYCELCIGNFRKSSIHFVKSFTSSELQLLTFSKNRVILYPFSGFIYTGVSKC